MQWIQVPCYFFKTEDSQVPPKITLISAYRVLRNLYVNIQPSDSYHQTNLGNPDIGKKQHCLKESYN